MPIQKLSAYNGWTKKEAKIHIQKKLRDFPNITLAGLESAIVVKRHLILSCKCTLYSGPSFVWPVVLQGLLPFILHMAFERQRLAKE